MAQALAEVLGAEAGAISIKAKTNEGMGFIGRGEGVAVMAVATLERR
jgi:2C-methyl-D-erythritol 2,4-cyclodiphosphate synthase